ncbi:anthranilate synthase component I family protein [Bacillus sp. HMF5848]|uniref:anthranilate synthase component I family protein n=1 Tax=Bacillus sp. HMF5848 TaxID=2495421 RepID=UPI000F7AF272|nr:anthranilate synthase component I family protein [Bacillus sp. HMF5848]RSK25508.1 anthranilate synthase component I family protein [Bacillus sp. HMF5848]
MQQRWTPYAKSIKISEDTWFDRYEKIVSKNSSSSAQHVVLESGRGGNYHIIGLEPFATLIGKNNSFIIKERGKQDQFIEEQPLVAMKAWMEQFKTVQHPELPDFQGGAIGFISYDTNRYIEKLPETSVDDLNTPDLYFNVFDEVFVYEIKTEQLWVIVLHESQDEAYKRIDELIVDWQEDKEETVGDIPYDPPSEAVESVSMTEEMFEEAVERVREYIAQGDVFQVNLSVRHSKPLYVHPRRIYQSLRNINPSPYMAYIEAENFHIVSGSPELLVKKSGKDVWTRPIAGTRSRGKNDEEDMALASELIENEKERAEHIMLVDLERNDLGRVCRYGTVEVDELMVIEKYSHVMHIVSNVRGELNEQTDIYDVIAAVFPGGTITGAPKVRTMEIIEELEPVRRGIYTGSIGWVGFSGDSELNIVIRTMFIQDGMAHVQAGAGIVIDSVAKREYKESMKKAAALWYAKERAEQRLE